MTLTNESTASQSKEPSKEGKELELCVNKEDMQITVRSLLQVPSRTSFILEVQFFKNSTQISNFQLQISFDLFCSDFTAVLCYCAAGQPFIPDTASLNHTGTCLTTHHLPSISASVNMRGCSAAELACLDSTSQK